MTPSLVRNGAESKVVCVILQSHNYFILPRKEYCFCIVHVFCLLKLVDMYKSMFFLVVKLPVA